MELREFAEQVLFATTLEEKLRSPIAITDDRPGPAMEPPAMPGRPDSLRFRDRDSGPRDFPGVHQLGKDEQRGRLLHFFANHELLATELMALVLLRFPEAPTTFRRGVLQTLKDEQEHTRLYVERMQACGVVFGELPVSGYFWRAVAPMQNPMDYVSNLSLTFEQANLDFAEYFARAFSTVGDQTTANLLKKIHQDEIAHVAYGLKWFRRWKNPTQSDWDAFCRQLKFPLSPQRAKGLLVNVEARRAAGLDAQFIAELNVFSQSKGRTPGVFVFNPFAEGYIAQGQSFTPINHQVQLARDLANLPQFLCRQDDLVLVEKRPSTEFLSGLQDAGFDLPEFVELNCSGTRPKVEHVPGLARKLGRLRPWAWGPDSVKLLSPLEDRVTGEAIPSAARSPERIARLYSKAWSADLLRSVLAEFREDWLCSEEDTGVVVRTMKEVLATIELIRRRGHHRIVVKEAVGLAGHNSIRLWEPALRESQRRWMANALARGQHLVVEPWLERRFDFSLQLEMAHGTGSHGVRVLAYTGLINDGKGQFRGNWAAPNYQRHLPAAVATLLREPQDIRARLSQLYSAVLSRLEPGLHDAGYSGPVGVDAFVYRAADGRCRLKPIVEINPRFTMGRLTAELMKRAAPGTFGTLRLWNRTMLIREGFEGFASYAKFLQETRPVQLEGQPVRKIRQGAVCLNDPLIANACLAVFEISQEAPVIPDN